jgi:RNA-dependent RNA polymerase
MADSQLNALTQLVKDCNMHGDAYRQFSMLHHENVKLEDIHRIIKRACDVITSDGVKENNEIRHGMKSCTWSGETSQTCDDFATNFLRSASKHNISVWLKHNVDESVDDFNELLHDGQFHLKVNACSLGALIDAFTFTEHATWHKSGTTDIDATFDFDKDQWKVNLRNFQDGFTYILESSFDQIKKAVIVQPGMNNGRRCFTLYIYLSAVPFLNRKFEQQFARMTELPDTPASTIGRCSVLRLELVNSTEETKMLTLMDKLYTSQFNVWWASIRCIPREQGDVDNHLENGQTPWSIKWLLSDGYRISDQLTVDDIALLHQHQDKLYAALQGQLVRDIIVDVMCVFKEVLRETMISPVQLPKLPNYTLIPKVLVTPTRLIFLPPEVVQFNRVMRKYNPENFITVSFRDENDRSMTSSSPRSLEEPVKRIKNFLLRGLMVGGRKYEFLGCSNSQLRIHGCWMYSQDPANPVTVDEIRRWMGEISDIHCVAVYVSRLGQFFSSSTNTIDLSGDDYTITEVPDVVRNGYCFTDGVGSIAVDTAKEVSSKQLILVLYYSHC